MVQDRSYLHVQAWQRQPTALVRGKQSDHDADDAWPSDQNVVTFTKSCSTPETAFRKLGAMTSF